MERWVGMPVKISHIVLHSPDHQAAVRFFTMDQWGIGVGGPQTMPHPAPDPCLFQPAEV